MLLYETRDKEMKYAYLNWQNTELAGGEKSINLGDCLQFLSIKYLYNSIGIDDKELVKLTMNDLKDYSGEEVVLPMNWALFDSHYMDGMFLSISNKIHPVFLAMTIESVYFKSVYFNEYNISYLKKYEPIGCRDRYTKEVLEEYGIDAYLMGCLTTCFWIKDNYVPKDIFFIDVPKCVEEYIPQEIISNFKIVSQQKYFGADKNCQDILDFACNHYKEIINTAKLVVTSRLHVVAPCIANEIPVLFIKDEIDYRFDWIEKYITLYDKCRLKDIDWNPSSVDYETERKIKTDFVINRIKNYGNKNIDSDVINGLYPAKRDYKYNWVHFQDTLCGDIENMINFMLKKYKLDGRINLCIWGATSYACDVVFQLKSRFKNMKLVAVLDMYKEGKFDDITIIKPINFNFNNEVFCVVVPIAASNYAEVFFEEIGFSSNNYYCLGNHFIK